MVEILGTFSTFFAMLDFQTLSTTELIDLLAKHTADYAKLMLDGTKEEFEHSKTSIVLLQQEINSRKQAADNTSITDTNIDFTDESA